MGGGFPQSTYFECLPRDYCGEVGSGRAETRNLTHRPFADPIGPLLLWLPHKAVDCGEGSQRTFNSPTAGSHSRFY